MEQTYIYWGVTAIVIAVAFRITAFNAKRWLGEERYLCTDCKFNTPEDCLKPDRPTALDCTAYRSGGAEMDNGIPVLPRADGG